MAKIDCPASGNKHSLGSKPLKCTWCKMHQENEARPKKPKPIEYKLDPSQWLEWVWERPEGDISVFAPTKAEAVRTMDEHGFSPPQSEYSKIKCHNRLLSDVLAKEPIS